MNHSKKSFKLEDLSSYKISADLSNIIYRLVKEWTFLDQKTVGLQWIRSTDSIAANIAEGFGRFHKKDKIKFFYNARASVYESAHWAKVTKERELLSEEDYKIIMKLIQKLPKELNFLIKFTNINLTI